MERVKLPTKKKITRVSVSDMALMRAKMNLGDQKPRVNPFVLPQVPARVVPKGRPTMAQDNAIVECNTWAGNQSSQFSQQNAAAWFGGVAYASAYQEGLAFPGYAFLSELAQRPEYRRMVEVIAMEMTRKWIKLTSVGDEDKTEAIRELTDELDRLRVREHFQKCMELDGYFGRGHLYIDTGSTADRDELKTSIGNGRDAISSAKIVKGSLRKLKAVEPVWTYPTNYNSIDPLTDDWYEPDTWFVMGKEIHRTRLLKFVGREVPDLLKPAYSFGGLSLLQMSMPYVNNWLRTRQSVADIIHAFSVMVLKTDLAESVQEGGEELFKRAAFFNFIRDNKGLMMIDKETEDFTNVSASLGGLEQLQAQTQEHMAAVSGIPIVKLLGIQPAGLNASSEGEIRTFYDYINAMQEKIIRPNLTTVIDIAQLNIWGRVDQSIVYKFEPLWSLDEKALAEVRKIAAETGISLVEAGILWQEEERKRIAADAESPYSSIDVEDVPDLREEEEAGLEPKSGAAKIAEGAAEEEGEIDVPTKGEEGEGDGGDEEEEEGEDSEPYEEGKLRDDYLEGENPLEEGASLRDGQPDDPSRGSPKNRQLAEAALKLREKPGYKGKLRPGYLDGESGIKGNNPLILAGKLQGKQLNPDHLKGKHHTDPNYMRNRAAQDEKKVGDEFKKDLPPGIGLDNDGNLVVVEDDEAEDKKGDFKESDHPRGQPGNAGQFGPGGEAKSNKSTAQRAETTLNAVFGKKLAEEYIASGQQVYDTNKTYCDQRDITSGEASFICSYTDSGFRKVNLQLRDQNLNSEMKECVDEINTALDKLPTRSGICHRWSPLPEGAYEQYQVGLVVEERGFTSTTKLDYWEYGPEVYHFVIMGQTGRDVSKFSMNHEEQEVLFKSGAHFKVTKKESNIIHLEEVVRQAQDKEFKESDHPRGQPENPGQFTSGGGGGGSKSKPEPAKIAKTELKPGRGATKVVGGKLVQANGSPLPPHIAKLKIPPAWTNVSFALDPKAKVQASGKDSKGRRQGIYNLEFSRKRAEAKFGLVNALQKKFPAIKSENEANRKKPETKNAADCMALIMAMGIRPGSDSDTGAEKKAYGATTLQARHVVRTSSGSLYLRFVGKKGVNLSLKVNDPAVEKMLTDRVAKLDKNERLFGDVSDSKLLVYVHSLNGGNFKTKDFRTLLGTETAMKEVNALGNKKPTNEKEYKKMVKEVAKKVADKLGNTPTIALQSYINPVVFAEWRI